MENKSNTCLFTGEPLNEDTLVEHAIPRSMGGRLESKIVSSSSFNNQCSQWDNKLKLLYEPFLNVLSPLLPREAQPGEMKIEVPGEPPGLVLEKGIMQRKGVNVTERDESGHPVKAYGKDIQSLQNIQKAFKEPCNITHEPIASDTPSFAGLLSNYGI